MKKTALLFLILSVALCYNNLKHSKGSDILDKLKGDANEVYVVMFTFGDQIKSNEELNKVNEQYEDDLFEILGRYSTFNYARIDAANEDYGDLVEACKIDQKQLVKSPSILMATKQEGIWVHGGETVEKIAEYAPAYEKRAKA